jgi:hypothetical protein
MGQIFLVAADVRHESAVENWNAIRGAGVGARATCYFSPKDIALWISGVVHRGKRAGVAEWEAVPIDSVDVSQLESRWSLNHCPHVHVQRVFTDMLLVTATNYDPPKRGLDKISQHYYFRV